MYNFKVASRYAEALFSIAREQNLNREVLDDLDFLCDLMDNSNDFNMLIKSPVIPHSKKKRLFDEIFKNKVSQVTYYFILLLAAKGRESLLKNIRHSYLKLYNTAEGYIPVTITTATPLPLELQEKIVMNIHNLTKRKVLPQYKIDSDVIGGIMLGIDNWIYDATIKRKLYLLKEQLMRE